MSAEPLLKAALLGLVEGVTEFIPGVLHRAPHPRQPLARSRPASAPRRSTSSSSSAPSWPSSGSTARGSTQAVLAARQRPGEPALPAQSADRLPAGRGGRVPGPRLDQGAAVHPHRGGAGAGRRRPAHPAHRAAAARARRVADVADVPPPTALGIGLAQVLSLIPGTSRSGATIMGGYALGLSRRAATEFSFFLSIPVMFAATLLRSAQELRRAQPPPTSRVRRRVRRLVRLAP